MFNIKACDSFFLLAIPAAQPNTEASVFFPMTFNHLLESHVIRMKSGELISEISLTEMKKRLCCIGPSFLEGEVGDPKGRFFHHSDLTVQSLYFLECKKPITLPL